MPRLINKIRDRIFNSDIKRGLEILTKQNQDLIQEIKTIRSQVGRIYDYNENFVDISNAPPAKGTLRLQQEAGANILALFDLFCHKNGLDYWLGAGNLIGVVRHKGEAIPWDDDVDVYMPRVDFEKAVELLPELLKSTDFGLVYRGFSLKIARYKRTAISFDVFPIDQYYKKIETTEEINSLHDKIPNSGLYSVSEWIAAAGYGPNWEDFFVPIWEGKNVRTPKKIMKLKEASLNRWKNQIMKNKTPVSDGHLMRGYERAAFPARLYSWKHEWVFPLRREKYMGVEVNIPNDPDNYLRSRYGDYWRFPKDFHRHTSHFGSKYENIEDLKQLVNLDINKYL